MKILIAEDDVTSRRILQAVLKKHGHEVVTTENGREAWDALQKPDAPKLAILDWMMPEMDGPDVIRRVRGLQTDRPPYIIMLTTRSEKASIIAGLKAGANDYLAKPFDPDELRARVEVGKRMIELQSVLSGKVEELQKTLNEVKTLRGLIPICSYCKKIRDDQGYWKQVELYVREHTEAQFTHGICPECFKKLEAELLRKPASGNGLSQQKQCRSAIPD